MRIILTIGMLLLFLSSHAQWFSGVFGATYGSDIKTPGYSTRLYYNISDHICFGPEFGYFFHNTHQINGVDILERRLWEINFVGHYNISLFNHFGFYPLTGFNLSREKTEYISENKNRKKINHENISPEKNYYVGINTGIGIIYHYHELVPFIETKYVIHNNSQFVHTIGVLYNFK